MERSTATAPVAAVAVSALGVTAVDQALCHEAPLHGGVPIAQHRQTLVDAPRHGAMVDDPVLPVEAAKTVPAVGTVLEHILIAQTEAHVAHDDIGARDVTGIVGHADTVARSGLSGNGHIAWNAEGRFQVDGA